MKAKICSFCRKEFLDDSENEDKSFCSEECYLQSKKTVWTTMSVRFATRNALILLQNDILSKTNRKISYTDLIDHILDIVNNELKPLRLDDKIINDYKYYL